MKVKTVVICCLAVVVFLSVYNQGNFASSKPVADQNLKIGVIRVRRIFEQCQKNIQFKEKMAAEQQKAYAELDKLKADLDAERAGLNTLKPGSTEYMDQVRQVLLKQGNLTAQQEYHKQQLALKEQKWIENIYADIVKVTAQVAEQKGLGLVLEGSEPELTDATAESLVMSIRTHKLIYSGGCLDLTDEVMSRLDSQK